MTRTIFVLALAVLSCAGCRAFGPNNSCGDPCCGDPCYDGYSQCGPGCGDACGPQCNGRGGNLAQSALCQGGSNCAFFGRYCGQQCGCGDGCGGGCPLGCNCRCNSCGCGNGYPAGAYDCSACDSPNWGCSGYRHPQGFVDGNRCYCDASGAPARPPGPHLGGMCCGNGYCCACCGQPAPSCCCNSGDHKYNFTPGPPMAQTAYPYYTLRGPRDFFLDNPPSIGPY